MNIKINDTLYPCTIKHTHVDHTWGHRESKAIRLEMDSATAAALFVDDASWGVVHPSVPVPDIETGKLVTPDPIVEDMSDFCMAGPIVDNRDGTVTVKMGKPTDKELLEIILGGKSV